MAFRFIGSVLFALAALSGFHAAAEARSWHGERRARFAKFTPPAAPIPGATLWDGPDYPEMIIVPPGDFMMGSPPQEPNRRADEGPQHRVRIARPFAVGKYAVTVGEFARFVADTRYDAGSTCKTFEGGQWDDHRPARNWRNPGFIQTAEDPVVCMNFADAQAYAAWVSRRTGHHYRLLSEAEYEYVNRAGTTTRWWWGDEIGGNHANCNACGNPVAHDGTVPVGSFPPNPFGLYETSGNAWTWVADCWRPDYIAAPSDGSAYLGGPCEQHAERGGAWFYSPGNLRFAIRIKDPNDLRNYHNGIRLAREL